MPSLHKELSQAHAQGHRAGIYGAAAWVTSGGVLRCATGAGDRALKVWGNDGGCRVSAREPTDDDVAAAAPKHRQQTIPWHTAEVYGVAACLDAQGEVRIVTGSADRRAKLWNGKGQCLATMTGHSDNVTCVAICVSDDGELRVVTGSADRSARMWDVKGHCLHTTRGRDGYKQWLKQLGLSGQDGEIRKYTDPISEGRRADPRKALRELLREEEEDGNGQLKDLIEVMHLTPDLETQFRDGVAHPGHVSGILGVAACRDASGGVVVVTASSDKTAKLWSETGEHIVTFVGHSDVVTSAAALQTQDGLRVVTGSDDNDARLWNGGGECIATLSGHTSMVNGVAMCLTSELAGSELRILTGSDDEMAKLWTVDETVEESVCMTTLAGHTGPITSVSACLNGDGDLRLLTGSQDCSGRLWDSQGNRVAKLASVKKTKTLLQLWSTIAVSALVLSFPMDQQFPWARQVDHIQKYLPVVRLALPAAQMPPFRLLYTIVCVLTVIYIGVVLSDMHGCMARMHERQRKSITKKDQFGMRVPTMGSKITGHMTDAVKGFIAAASVVVLPGVVQTFISSLDCSHSYNLNTTNVNDAGGGGFGLQAVDNDFAGSGSDGGRTSAAEQTVSAQSLQEPEVADYLAWDRDHTVTCFSGDHLTLYAIPSLVLLPVYLLCALRLSIEEGHVERISITYEGNWVLRLFGCQDGNGAETGGSCRGTWWKDSRPVALPVIGTTVHTGKFGLMLQTTNIIFSAAVDLMNNHHVALSLIFLVGVSINLAAAPYLPTYTSHSTQAAYEGFCKSLVARLCFVRAFRLFRLHVSGTRFL